MNALAHHIPDRSLPAEAGHSADDLAQALEAKGEALPEWLKLLGAFEALHAAERVVPGVLTRAYQRLSPDGPEPVLREMEARLGLIAERQDANTTAHRWNRGEHDLDALRRMAEWSAKSRAAHRKLIDRCAGHYSNIEAARLWADLWKWAEQDGDEHGALRYRANLLECLEVTSG